jgi:hypothetical protein
VVAEAMQRLWSVPAAAKRDAAVDAAAGASRGFVAIGGESGSQRFEVKEVCRDDMFVCVVI